MGKGIKVCFDPCVSVFDPEFDMGIHSWLEGDRPGPRTVNMKRKLKDRKKRKSVRRQRKHERYQR